MRSEKKSQRLNKSGKPTTIVPRSIAPGASNRRGVTLLEMVLVLALLAVVSSLIVPRMMGSVSSRRLSLAADEVRTAWAKGRTMAMRSGETHQFLFLPESRVYTLVVQTATAEGDDLYEQALSALTTLGNAVDEQAYQQDSQRLSYDIQIDRLPTGITFLDLAIAAQLSSLPTPDSSANMDTGIGSVSFYADGTTSTSTVWLSSEDDEAISIWLRGMTGMSTVGEPIVGVTGNRGDSP